MVANILTNTAKFHPNERVDFDDAEFLARAPVNLLQAMNLGVVTGNAARILDGFTFTLDVGNPTVMTIQRGLAIVPEFVDGAAHAGQLLYDGVDEQAVDFTGKSVATHGVWIRFLFATGEYANRVIWDDAAVAGKVRAVTTRQVAGWQAAIADSSPGADWAQIYNVAYDGGNLATSVITDKRTFLFDGPADSTPAFTPSWGGGLDRNADRALHGVKTLERFASAALKKLEEMQSATARWWEATAEPLDKKVSRSGDTMNGSYEITGALTVDGDLDAATLLTGGVTITGAPGLLVTQNDSGTEAPIPSDADLTRSIFRNANSTVGAHTAQFFMHAGADAGDDGVVIFSERIAEDDVDLRFGIIKDGAYLTTMFSFDMDLGNFAAAGAISAVGGSLSSLVNFRGTVGGRLSDGAIDFVGDIIPDTDDALRVGHSDARWLSGFFQDIDADGVLVLASGGDTPAINKFNADSIGKAWGIFTINADGDGSGTGTCTSIEGQHFASAKCVSAFGKICVQVTLAKHMASVNFAPEAQHWAHNGLVGLPGAILHVVTDNTHTDQFYILAFDPQAGTYYNLDTAAVAKIRFSVDGKQ